MSDSMIERVARALDPEVWRESEWPPGAALLKFRQISLRQARAAIEEYEKYKAGIPAKRD